MVRWKYHKKTIGQEIQIRERKRRQEIRRGKKKERKAVQEKE
jgi:hypothetical protein